LNPEVRYGFSNHHLNANISAGYQYGKKFSNSISISFGSDVFQFNNANPVGTLGSTIGALVRGINNLKIYEAEYGRLNYTKGLGAGLNLILGTEFQNRKPLENSSDFSLNKGETKFTANRPFPLIDANIRKHQALKATIGIRWQPGTKYIEFPNRVVSIGSKYPVFTANYTLGVKHFLGSDVDFSKWVISISDDIGLKLKGNFQYRFFVGGFINSNKVEIPDLIHFRGNPSNLIAEGYLSRFQLVPHYQFSHSEKFYSTLFAEHHFNGFITNKIPGLKHLKWNLVSAVNSLYLNANRYYIEPSIGIENIFKIIRVDYLWGYENNNTSRQGFRIGFKYILGNQ
jgi:hypothetical protein